MRHGGRDTSAALARFFPALFVFLDETATAALVTNITHSCITPPRGGVPPSPDNRHMILVYVATAGVT